MKRTLFAATAVLSLVVAGHGAARAAGQPQLPGGMQGQESAQERMETKQALDPDKYDKRHSAASRQQAAPSAKPSLRAKTEAVHRGAVGKAPRPGPEATGAAQAGPSPGAAPLATPGAVEAEHGTTESK